MCWFGTLYDTRYKSQLKAFGYFFFVFSCCMMRKKVIKMLTPQ